uniref:Odorant binding protein n=1 Tax=Heliothis virescens TaxID=7102 RepID=A0A2A4K8R4_HELVI
MFNLFFCVFVCGVLSVNVQASSLEDLKMKYVEMIIECSNNFPITAGDMVQLKRKIMPDNESIKCLFACVYKKSGMMDDQGYLSVEGVNEMTRKYLSDDPEKLRKSEEFTEACKSVNDVPVNDGDQGCERAALIFKCTVEKSPDALTEEELKLEFTKLIMKCNKDSEVDMQELVQLQSYVVPTKTATKCVLACAYKASSVMNAQGLYDIDHAYKVAEMMKNGDEKRLTNAKKMADICVKVIVTSIENRREVTSQKPCNSDLP